MKYAGANKALCDQLLKEWETSKDPGGHTQLSKYLEMSGLNVSTVFSQMDWEYIDNAEIAEANTLTLTLS